MDGQQHTVILIQVENEIGALDRSPVAMKLSRAGAEGADGLPQPRKILDSGTAPGVEAAASKHPEPGGSIRKAARRMRSSCPGTLRATSTGCRGGQGRISDPMYVNGYVNGFPRAGHAPAPTGSPWPTRSTYGGRCAEDRSDRGRRLQELRRDEHTYHGGNPLFVPRPEDCAGQSGDPALYAFGRHDAIGMSLMA